MDLRLVMRSCAWSCASFLSLWSRRLSIWGICELKATINAAWRPSSPHCSPFHSLFHALTPPLSCSRWSLSLFPPISVSLSALSWWWKDVKRKERVEEMATRDTNGRQRENKKVGETEKERQEKKQVREREIKREIEGDRGREVMEVWGDRHKLTRLSEKWQSNWHICFNYPASTRCH